MTRKNKLYLSLLLPAILLVLGILSCGRKTAPGPGDKIAIASMLDSFNLAAARADFDQYFAYYTDDAHFVGTDATENWTKQAFMKWARPAFEKKRTWHFTAVQRNIYFGQDADIAWFDELLNTQMKICRGSGVVVRDQGRWKLEQYVLSMTFPNDLIDTIVKIKSPVEDSLLRTLSPK